MLCTKTPGDEPGVLRIARPTPLRPAAMNKATTAAILGPRFEGSRTASKRADISSGGAALGELAVGAVLLRVRGGSGQGWMEGELLERAVGGRGGGRVRWENVAGVSTAVISAAGGGEAAAGRALFLPSTSMASPHFRQRNLTSLPRIKSSGT
jgi:hypothetical protein